MRPIAGVGAAGVALIGAVYAFQGHAADLGPVYPAPAAYAEPDAQVELGTGWYLRGDVGWSDPSREQLLASLPKLTQSTDWNGDIGAGYRWNNWFRTDLTLNFEGIPSVSQTTDPVTCVYALTGQVAQDVAQTKLGYFWTPNLGTCDGHNRASLLKTDVMVGGYVDIGTWAGLTPYIGAGVGFSRLDAFTSQDYNKTSDGSTYKQNLTATGDAFPLIWRDEFGRVVTPTVPTTGQPVAFAKQNWSKKEQRTLYNFAWSLTGGVAYAIDDHLSVDLAYRYVNLGSYKNAVGRSATVDAQQVRVGFRYAID